MFYVVFLSIIQDLGYNAINNSTQQHEHTKGQNKMTKQHLIEQIRHISSVMFRQNLFGIYHGSISARIDTDTFLINTKDAIFDNIDDRSLMILSHTLVDNRWDLASIDAHTHAEIYRQIPHAKYIIYSMAPNATAYSLRHDTFTPLDFFGDKFIGDIDIYDPGDFSDWYDRAPHEITSCFAKYGQDTILVRGYGLFAYGRNLVQIAHKVAILENSVRLSTPTQNQNR